MDTHTYQQQRKDLLKYIDQLDECKQKIFKDPKLLEKLPIDIRENKIMSLNREKRRLQNPNLTIAFVGGFSAGKSSLVNSFLGRYLLPESTRVTTAVPTHIRSTQEESEYAELHYLTEQEVNELENMYRKELADRFNRPQFQELPFSDLIEEANNLATEGRGRKLIEHFTTFMTERKKREISIRGKVKSCSISESQDIIKNEVESMFLDRVELHIHNDNIPSDVVIVDLPGVSVPNPRHRKITFDFIRDQAHAVVFVLIASRLFDKDEVEIMELFRSGETQITDKVFWVLNRWDALSTRQEQETMLDFEQKMKDFSIPDGYQCFQTNALDGLLSQLKINNHHDSDSSLIQHFEDYEERLSTQYNSSNTVAYKKSQIPKLQKKVFSFLNEHLRQTTLSSARQNLYHNFVLPLAQYLRHEKITIDNSIQSDLDQQQKEKTMQEVNQKFEQRVDGFKRELNDLRSEVATKRSKVILEKTKDVEKELQATIQEGDSTDAYEIYKEIIGNKVLRKFPYHFEIEMKIVDELNTTIKQNFRVIVRDQVQEVFKELSTRVEKGLNQIKQDINYDDKVLQPITKILHSQRNSFINRVDGLVMSFTAKLDELLKYEAVPLWNFWKPGNALLKGLEKAAQLGVDKIYDSTKAVSKDDFSSKTTQIRDTLSKYYVDQVQQYHETITKDIFPIIINNMQQIEREILKVLHTQYKSTLELCVAHALKGQFSSQRRYLSERSTWFRSLIDQLDEVSNHIAV